MLKKADGNAWTCLARATDIPALIRDSNLKSGSVTEDKYLPLKNLVRSSKVFEKNILILYMYR